MLFIITPIITRTDTLGENGLFEVIFVAVVVVVVLKYHLVIRKKIPFTFSFPCRTPPGYIRNPTVLHLPREHIISMRKRPGIALRAHLNKHTLQAGDGCLRKLVRWSSGGKETKDRVSATLL